MGKNNAAKANEHDVKKQKGVSSLRKVMTNDKYCAIVVSNEINAQEFFQITLPERVLEQLDLSTLQTVRTRDVDSDGIEKIGDIFFIVDLKNRAGKTRRRAAFVIAAEHKTEDDVYVPIQLLGYVSALLDRMLENRDFYADENGLLPTPYVIVFSQDARPREQPARLGDVLWTLEGLEGTVPNFEYQTIYANQISLDKIRECEPVMRTFLYLTQIANRKHTEEEDAELGATFLQILESPSSDERVKRCAYASLNYFLRLQEKRPGMMTLPELRKEMERQKGGSMEEGLYIFCEKEFAERYEQGLQSGMQTGIQTGIQTGLQTGIHNVICSNLKAKYGKDAVTESLKKKFDAINYYPALEEIQLAILTTPSLEAFKRKIARIINKYRVEIEEVRR